MRPGGAQLLQLHQVGLEYCEGAFELREQFFSVSVVTPQRSDRRYDFALPRNDGAPAQNVLPCQLNLAAHSSPAIAGGSAIASLSHRRLGFATASDVDTSARNTIWF